MAKGEIYKMSAVETPIRLGNRDFLLIPFTDTAMEIKFGRRRADFCIWYLRYPQGVQGKMSIPGGWNGAREKNTEPEKQIGVTGVKTMV